MAVIRRGSQTLASLQCRDGARRVFTDQADNACTKRELAVRCSASRVDDEPRLPRTTCEADTGTLCVRSRIPDDSIELLDLFSGRGRFQRHQ